MPRSRPRLSLVEATLLISIAGLVLAVFVPTFVRRVRTNKILEASELLGELSLRTASYYNTTWDGGHSRCLPAEAGPTPVEPTVDAAEVDFFDPSALGHATWEAIGFQPSGPVRYSYQYTPGASGCNLGGEGREQWVVWSAEGDLDGDAVVSRFELRARPRPDGTLEPEGVLHVHQRVE